MSLTLIAPSSTIKNLKDAVKRGRGRPPVPTHEVEVMRKLRAAGHTLRQVSYFVERCIPTVSKYTSNIPHKNRPNKSVCINRRTGLAIK
jgi:DNA-binding NarL/FixJ family response regulator